MAKKKQKRQINPDRKLEHLTTPPEPVNPQTIGDLRPAGYNPRTISPEQKEMLRQSMEEYGDLSGVVFNRNTGRLVGGHQRHKILLEMFDKEWPITKEPVTDATGTVARGEIQTPIGTFMYREVDWDEEKEKGANIAANKHGGEFEDDILSQLLQNLYDSGYRMELTGFDEKELRELITFEEDKNLGDPEHIVEPQENPFVQLGDLWICGESRLLCGESTDLDDIKKLMMGDLADLVVTDPPYNVAYEGSAGEIENDDMDDDDFKEFLRNVFFAMSQALKPGGCFYIYHAEGQNLGHTFSDAIVGTPNMALKQKLVWIKNSAPMSRQDYNWLHEPILYGWKEGAGHYFNGDFTQTTVIDDDIDLSKLDKKQLKELVSTMRNREPSSVIRVDRPAKSEFHPTTKPVRLFERHVIASSRPGEIVLDQFSGSGTTIVTCRKTGRKGRAMELDPKYAQASLIRYQMYSGEEPMLVAPDGRQIPFSEVEQERKK